MKPTLYIDVAPLQELHYTGIPHVAAKLCEMALGDETIEAHFFCHRQDVPVALLCDALKRRSGAALGWAMERYAFQPALPTMGGGTVWGLHTNVKQARRLFPVEGQIIHDLTPVVTPEHHTAETNMHHQTRFLGDLLSNDVTFTVSAATAIDVRTYYPQAAERPIIVSHLGVDWTHIPQALREQGGEAEPYLLVLGTLEPRKNIGVVLDLLQAHPEIAQRLRIVFGGRIGWGRSFEAELEARGLMALEANGRIVQTGFISEAAKYLLFRHARAVIYPSVYEGFGLPVAEAISLGTPVVTTASTSLPEVGRDLAQYFLPDDVASLHAALERALAEPRGEVSAARRAWLKHFAWRQCYGRIKAGFEQVAPSGTAAA